MLVVAGNLTLDDTVMPDGRTTMGGIGGDVLYTALGAAIWSTPVGLLGRAGDDLPAGALDGIEDAGLDCRGLIPVAGPNIHYWVLYEWDGRRHFIRRNPTDRLDALSPEPEDLPLDYLPDMHAFHVAAIPFDKAERLIRYAATLPLRPAISLDTHEDYVDGYQDRFAALMPLLTAFLPSREGGGALVRRRRSRATYRRSAGTWAADRGDQAGCRWGADPGSRRSRPATHPRLRQRCRGRHRRRRRLLRRLRGQDADGGLAARVGTGGGRLRLLCRRAVRLTGAHRDRSHICRATPGYLESAAIAEQPLNTYTYGIRWPDLRRVPEGSALVQARATGQRVDMGLAPTSMRSV